MSNGNVFEMDLLGKAKIVHYKGGPVYHPLLSHTNREGFYTSIEDCVDAFESTKIDPFLWKYGTFCFAALPYTCQSLDINEVLESAAQGMDDDWLERVEESCALEIQDAQNYLNILYSTLKSITSYEVDLKRKYSLLPELKVKKHES